MLTVYSKDACPACDKAIALLTKKETEFKVIKIVASNPADDQITRESFIEQFPGIRVVPYIVGESVELKSFNDLQSFLEEYTT